jgi:hypothetical protein
MSLRENSKERRRKSSSLQERKNKTSVFIWFLFFFRIIFAIAFNSPLIGRLLLLWRVRHVRITRAWWPYSPLDYIRQSCVGAQRIRDYLASWHTTPAQQYLRYRNQLNESKPWFYKKKLISY